jgi:RecB family exonuclease
MGFVRLRTSFSQVRRYEQCPKSFELHYVRGLRPETTSDAAVLGKAVHASCEALVREIVAGGAAARVSTECARAAFDRAWAAAGANGLSLYEEGAKMVTDFAVDQGEVAPDRVLALEQRFLVPAGDFAVLGFIDRVDRLGDAAIEIIDYKTNHQLFTRAELENDLQLPLYAAAAQTLWPWAKEVRLTFWMLRHRMRVPVQRTPEQVSEALRYMAMMAEKATSAKEFAANLGSHCAYCEHRARCEAYAAALRGGRRFVCADANDVEAVAREREEVAGLVRILEGRKGELDHLLKSRLKSTDEVHAAGMRYRMVPTKSGAEYPLAPTLDAVGGATGQAREELVDRLAVIDANALAKLVEELEPTMPKGRWNTLRAELEARAIRAITPRFMATKE